MTIDTNNRVGIGIESPERKLHITETSGSTYVRIGNALSDPGILEFEASRSPGSGQQHSIGEIRWSNDNFSNTPVSMVAYIGGSGAAQKLGVNFDGTEKFSVDQNGNATFAGDVTLGLGRWLPQLGPETVTGGFENGCTVNTWYNITNISNWNAYLGGYGGDWKGIHFAIFWTTGNTAKGYNHQVVGWCPPGSCNTTSAYNSSAYVTHNSGTTTTSGIPITVHHHTSVSSAHDIRVRTFNDGASYGPLRLQIYASTSPNAGNAQITFWRA